MEAQKAARIGRLSDNLKSGIAVLLSTDSTSDDTLRAIDISGKQEDSILVGKSSWGAFDLNIIKAFISKDTLKQVFLSGSLFADPSAIYLADEDRPLLLSGSTMISGDVEVPRSGIRAAYVDGKPYISKKLVNGRTKESARVLPSLNIPLISRLVTRFEKEGGKLPALDTLENSFFNDVAIYKLQGDDCELKPKLISGRIIIIADSTLTIKSGTTLRNIQIYAPSIIIEGGFKGDCQLFARDSIIMGKDCEFQYPSFAGVFKSENTTVQPKVSLGDGSHFSGILFTYERKRSELQTLISIGKNCILKGQVYASGYIKLDKPVNIAGKVYTTRFIMQTPATLYENYLIDVSIDRKSLSKYYLTSSLFEIKNEEQKVLQWLN
jgi:cytoskeletal protein CcmA (bactofilin family)